MRLYNVYGKLVYKNVSRYLLDWDKKSRSKPQFRVKKFLEPYWQNDVVYEEFPVYGTLLKVDILNATKRIAVEVHGPQHGSFHYFHNESPSAYLASIKRDAKKYQWLEQNGFKVIEIYDNEIDTLSPKFFLDKFGVQLK